MRRVNQAYVIATSMSVDVSKVKIPATDDSYFTREETAKKTDEDQFFEQAAKVKQALVQEIRQVTTRRGTRCRCTCRVQSREYGSRVCEDVVNFLVQASISQRDCGCVFMFFNVWCRSMAGFSSGGLLVARSCHPKPNCSRNDDVGCSLHDAPVTRCDDTPSLRYHRRDGALRREGVCCEGLTSSRRVFAWCSSPLLFCSCPCPTELDGVRPAQGRPEDRRRRGVGRYDQPLVEGVPQRQVLAQEGRPPSRDGLLN